MARKRMISPEFWDDEKLGTMVCRDARLMWIGMWNHSDDYGVCRGNPIWLKGKIFAYDDDITATVVLHYLSELESNGFIYAFKNDGQIYYFSKNWDKHQIVNKPSKTTRNPEPPKGLTDTTTRLTESYNTTTVGLLPNRIEKNRIEKNRSGLHHYSSGEDEIDKILKILKTVDHPDYQNIQRDDWWEPRLYDFINRFGFEMVQDEVYGLVAWVSDPEHPDRLGKKANPKNRFNNWMKDKKPRPKDEPEPDESWRPVPEKHTLDDHRWWLLYVPMDQWPADYVPPPADHEIWGRHDHDIKKLWDHFYPGKKKPEMVIPSGRELMRRAREGRVKSE